MLRESMQMSGRSVDVAGATRGFDDSTGIPHAALLAGFAEAVVRGDEAALASARAALRGALGEAGFVDACAVAAAFHGFVRIADSIGIPYTTAARGEDAPEIRARSGVNDFPRVRGEAAAS